MLEFAKENPDATVKERIEYYESLDPKIIAEDDDEEDED